MKFTFLYPRRSYRDVIAMTGEINLHQIQGSAREVPAGPAGGFERVRY